MGEKLHGLRLIFLGPPGVGKGTQAQKLANQFSLKKISTGDILREAISRKTPLGIQAKAFIDSGRLVPDDVVIGVIRDKLSDPDCRLGYVLDGFPRTLPQAESLAEILEKQGTPIHQVVSFEIPEQELTKRLTGRRSCPGCQAIYHLDFHPPQQPDRCDNCGKGLIQREDDREETVRKRLSVYKEQTAPLLKYYEDRRILKTIEGASPIEAVFERLLAVLKTVNPSEQ